MAQYKASRKGQTRANAGYKIPFLTCIAIILIFISAILDHQLPYLSPLKYVSFSQSYVPHVKIPLFYDVAHASHFNGSQEQSFDFILSSITSDNQSGCDLPIDGNVKQDSENSLFGFEYVDEYRNLQGSHGFENGKFNSRTSGHVTESQNYLYPVVGYGFRYRRYKSPCNLGGYTAANAQYGVAVPPVEYSGLVKSVSLQCGDSGGDSCLTFGGGSRSTTYLMVPLHFTASFRGQLDIEEKPTSLASSNSAATDSNEVNPLLFYGRRFLITSPFAAEMASRGRGSYRGALAQSRDGHRLRFVLSTILPRSNQKRTITETTAAAATIPTTLIPTHTCTNASCDSSTTSDWIDIPLVTIPISNGGGGGGGGGGGMNGGPGGIVNFELSGNATVPRLPEMRPIVMVSMNRAATVSTSQGQSPLISTLTGAFVTGDTEVIVNGVIFVGFLDRSHGKYEPQSLNLSEIRKMIKSGAASRLARAQRSTTRCGAKVPMPALPIRLPSMAQMTRSSVPSLNSKNLTNSSDTAIYKLGHRSLSLKLQVPEATDEALLCKPHIFHSGHVYSTRPIRSGVPEYFYAHFSLITKGSLEILLNPDGIMSLGVKNLGDYMFHQTTGTTTAPTSTAPETAHIFSVPVEPPATTDEHGGKSRSFGFQSTVDGEQGSSSQMQNFSSFIEAETQKFIYGVDEEELCSWVMTDNYVTSWGPLLESLPSRSCDSVTVVGAPIETTLRALDKQKNKLGEPGGAGHGQPQPSGASNQPRMPKPPKNPFVMEIASKSVAVFSANITKLRPVGMPWFNITVTNGTISSVFSHRPADAEEPLPLKWGNENSDLTNAVYPADLFIDWKSDYTTRVSLPVTGGKPKGYPNTTTGSNAKPMPYENINSVVCLIGDQTSYNMTFIPANDRLMLDAETLRPTAIRFYGNVTSSEPGAYLKSPRSRLSVGQPFRCYKYDTVDDLHFACGSFPACVGFTTIRMQRAVERPLCMYIIGNLSYDDVMPYQRMYYQRPSKGTACSVRLVNTTLLLALEKAKLQQQKATPPTTTQTTQTATTTSTTTTTTSWRPQFTKAPSVNISSNQTSGVLSIYLLQSAMATGVAVVRINGVLTASCGGEKPFAGGYMGEDARCGHWVLCYTSSEPIEAAEPPVISVTPTSLLPQGICEHSFGAMFVFEANVVPQPIIYKAPPQFPPAANIPPRPGLPPRVVVNGTASPVTSVLDLGPSFPNPALFTTLATLTQTNPSFNQPRNRLNMNGYQYRLVSRRTGHHDDPIRIFVFRGETAALDVAQTAHGSFHLRRGVTTYTVPTSTVSMTTDLTCQHCGGSSGFYGGDDGLSGQCSTFYFCGSILTLAAQAGSPTACLANGVANPVGDYTGYITVQLNMSEIGRQSLDALTGNIGCDGFFAKLYVYQQAGTAGSTPLFPFLGVGGFPRILIAVPNSVASPAELSRMTGFGITQTSLLTRLMSIPVMADSNGFDLAQIAIYNAQFSALTSDLLQTALPANISLMCIVDHVLDEGPIMCTFVIPQNATHVKVRAAQTDFVENEMGVAISLDGFSISATDTCGGSSGADGSPSMNFQDGSVSHLASNFGFRSGRAGECETFLTCTDRDLFDRPTDYSKRDNSKQGSVTVSMPSGMRSRGCNFITAIIVEFSDPYSVGFQNSLLDLPTTTGRATSETTVPVFDDLPDPGPSTDPDACHSDTCTTSSNACSDASVRYQCPSEQRFIIADKLCDGVQDCFTGSDETFCQNWMLLEGEVFCTVLQDGAEESTPMRTLASNLTERCRVGSRQQCQRLAILNNSYAFSYFPSTRNCVIYQNSLSLIAAPSKHLCKAFATSEHADPFYFASNVETMVLLPRGSMSFESCRPSIHCGGKGLIVYSKVSFKGWRLKALALAKSSSQPFFFRSGSLLGVGAHFCTCDCSIGWSGPNCQIKNQLNRIMSIVLTLNATVATMKVSQQFFNFTFQPSSSVAILPFPTNLHLLGRGVELQNDRVKATCRDTAPLVDYHLSRYLSSQDEVDMNDPKSNALMQVECTLRVKQAGPLGNRPIYRSKLYGETPVMSPQPWGDGGAGERTIIGDMLSQEEDSMLQRHFKYLATPNVGVSAVNTKISSNRYQSQAPVPAVLFISTRGMLDTFLDMKSKGIDCTQNKGEPSSSTSPSILQCRSNTSVFVGKVRITVVSAQAALAANITVSSTVKSIPLDVDSGSQRSGRFSKTVLSITNCVFAPGPRFGGCARSLCDVELPPIDSSEYDASFETDTDLYFPTFELQLSGVEYSKDVRSDTDECSSAELSVAMISSMDGITPSLETSEPLATNISKSWVMLLSGCIMVIMLAMNLVGAVIAGASYKRGLWALIVAQGPPSKMELFERVRVVDMHAERAREVEAKRRNEEFRATLARDVKGTFGGLHIPPPPAIRSMPVFARFRPKSAPFTAATCASVRFLRARLLLPQLREEDLKDLERHARQTREDQINEGSYGYLNATMFHLWIIWFKAVRPFYLYPDFFQSTFLVFSCICVVYIVPFLGAYVTIDEVSVNYQVVFEEYSGPTCGRILSQSAASDSFSPLGVSFPSSPGSKIDVCDQMETIGGTYLGFPIYSEASCVGVNGKYELELSVGFSREECFKKKPRTFQSGACVALSELLTQPSGIYKSSDPSVISTVYYRMTCTTGRQAVEYVRKVEDMTEGGKEKATPTISPDDEEVFMCLGEQYGIRILTPHKLLNFSESSRATSTSRRSLATSLGVGDNDKFFRGGNYTFTHGFMLGNTMSFSTSYSRYAVESVASLNQFDGEDLRYWRIVSQSTMCDSPSSPTCFAQLPSAKSARMSKAIFQSLFGSQDIKAQNLDYPSVGDLPVGTLYNKPDLDEHAYAWRTAAATAHRYYGISRSPFDFGHHFSLLERGGRVDTGESFYTISMWLRVGPTTSGFAYAVADAVECAQSFRVSAPEKLGSVLDGQIRKATWRRLPYRVYQSLFVDGRRSRLVFAHASKESGVNVVEFFDGGYGYRGSTIDSTARDESTAATASNLSNCNIFDSKWHQVALSFSVINKRIAVTLIVDGERMATKFLNSKPPPPISDPTEISANMGSTKVTTGGVLVTGYFNGGLYRLQAHTSNVNHAYWAASGTAEMRSRSAFPSAASVAMHAILIVLGSGIFLFFAFMYLRRTIKFVRVANERKYKAVAFAFYQAQFLLKVHGGELFSHANSAAHSSHTSSSVTNNVAHDPNSAMLLCEDLTPIRLSTALRWSGLSIEAFREVLAVLIEVYGHEESTTNNSNGCQSNPLSNTNLISENPMANNTPTNVSSAASSFRHRQGSKLHGMRSALDSGSQVLKTHHKIDSASSLPQDQKSDKGAATEQQQAAPTAAAAAAAADEPLTPEAISAILPSIRRLLLLIYNAKMGNVETPEQSAARQAAFHEWSINIGGKGSPTNAESGNQSPLTKAEGSGNAADTTNRNINRSKVGRYPAARATSHRGSKVFHTAGRHPSIHNVQPSTRGEVLSPTVGRTMLNQHQPLSPPVQQHGDLSRGSSLRTANISPTASFTASNTNSAGNQPAVSNNSNLTSLLTLSNTTTGAIVPESSTFSTPPKGKQQLHQSDSQTAFGASHGMQQVRSPVMNLDQTTSLPKFPSTSNTVGERDGSTSFSPISPTSFNAKAHSKGNANYNSKEASDDVRMFTSVVGDDLPEVTPMLARAPHPFETFSVGEWNREALKYERLLKGPLGGESFFLGLWVVVVDALSSLMWMKILSNYTRSEDEKMFDNFFDGTRELLHGAAMGARSGTARGDLDMLIADSPMPHHQQGSPNGKSSKSRVVSIRRRSIREQESEAAQFTAESGDSENSKTEGESDGDKKKTADASAAEGAKLSPSALVKAMSNNSSPLPPTPTPTKGFANRIGASIAVFFVAVSTLQQVYLWQVSLLSLPEAYVSAYGDLLQAATLDVSGVLPFTIDFSSWGDSATDYLFSPSPVISSLDSAHMLPIIRFAVPLFSLGMLILSLQSSSRWFWVSAYKMCSAIDLRVAVIVLRGLRGKGPRNLKQKKPTPSTQKRTDAQNLQINQDVEESETIGGNPLQVDGPVPTSRQQIEEIEREDPLEFDQHKGILDGNHDMEYDVESEVRSLPAMVEGDLDLRGPSASPKPQPHHDEHPPEPMIEVAPLPPLTNLPLLATITLPISSTPVTVLLSTAEARKLDVITSHVEAVNEGYIKAIATINGRIPLGTVFASSSTSASNTNLATSNANHSTQNSNSNVASLFKNRGGSLPPFAFRHLPAGALWESVAARTAGTCQTITDEMGGSRTELSMKDIVAAANGLVIHTTVDYKLPAHGSFATSRSDVRSSTTATVVVSSGLDPTKRTQLISTSWAVMAKQRIANGLVSILKSSSASLTKSFADEVKNNREQVTRGQEVKVRALLELAERSQHHAGETADGTQIDVPNIDRDHQRKEAEDEKVLICKVRVGRSTIFNLPTLGHCCSQHPLRSLSAHFTPNPDHAGTSAEFPQCCAVANGQRCRKRAPRNLVFVCGHETKPKPAPVNDDTLPCSERSLSSFGRTEVCHFALCFDHYRPSSCRTMLFAMAEGLVRAILAKGIVWCVGVFCLFITIMCYVPFLFTGIMILSSHEYYVATFAGVYFGLGGDWRASGRGGFLSIEGAHRGVVEAPAFSADVVGTSLGVLYPVVEGRRKGGDWGIYFSFMGLCILGVLYPVVIVYFVRRRLKILRGLVTEMTSEAFNAMFANTTHNYMQSLKQRAMLAKIHGRLGEGLGAVYVPEEQLKKRGTDEDMALVEADAEFRPPDPYAAAKAAMAEELKKSSTEQKLGRKQPKVLPIFVPESKTLHLQQPLTHPFNRSGNEEVAELTALVANHSSFTAPDGTPTRNSASSSGQNQNTLNASLLVHHQQSSVHPLLQNAALASTQPWLHHWQDQRPIEADHLSGSGSRGFASEGGSGGGGAINRANSLNNNVDGGFSSREEDEDIITLPPPSLRTVEGSPAGAGGRATMHLSAALSMSAKSLVASRGRQASLGSNPLMSLGGEAAQNATDGAHEEPKVHAFPHAMLHPNGATGGVRKLNTVEMHPRQQEAITPPTGALLKPTRPLAVLPPRQHQMAPPPNYRINPLSHHHPQFQRQNQDFKFIALANQAPYQEPPPADTAPFILRSVFPKPLTQPSFSPVPSPLSKPHPHLHPHLDIGRPNAVNRRNINVPFWAQGRVGGDVEDVESSDNASTPDMGKSVLDHLGINLADEYDKEGNTSDHPHHLVESTDTDMNTGTGDDEEVIDFRNVERRARGHHKAAADDDSDEDPIGTLILRARRGLGELNFFRDTTKDRPWQSGPLAEAADVAALVRQWFAIAAFDHYSVLSVLCSYHLNYRRMAKTPPSLAKLLAPLTFLMLRVLVCLPAILLPPESLSQRLGCSVFEVLFVLLPVCHFVFTEKPATPIAVALLAAVIHQVLFLGVHSINMADRFDPNRHPVTPSHLFDLGVEGASKHSTAMSSYAKSIKPISTELVQFPSGFPNNPTYNERQVSDVTLIAITGVYLAVMLLTIVHLMILVPLWDALFARPSSVSMWAYAASFSLTRTKAEEREINRKKRTTTSFRRRLTEAIQAVDVRNKRRGGKAGAGPTTAASANISRSNSLTANKNTSDEYALAAQLISPLLIVPFNRGALNDVHATSSASYFHRRSVLRALRCIPYCYHPLLEVPFYVDPAFHADEIIFNEREHSRAACKTKSARQSNHRSGFLRWLFGSRTDEVPNAGLEEEGEQAIQQVNTTPEADNHVATGDNGGVLTATSSVSNILFESIVDENTIAVGEDTPGDDCEKTQPTTGDQRPHHPLLTSLPVRSLAGHHNHFQVAHSPGDKNDDVLAAVTTSPSTNGTHSSSTKSSGGNISSTPTGRSHYSNSGLPLADSSVRWQNRHPNTALITQFTKASQLSPLVLPTPVAASPENLQQKTTASPQPQPQPQYSPRSPARIAPPKKPITPPFDAELTPMDIFGSPQFMLVPIRAPVPISGPSVPVQQRSNQQPEVMTSLPPPGSFVPLPMAFSTSFANSSGHDGAPSSLSVSKPYSGREAPHVLSISSSSQSHTVYGKATAADDGMFVQPLPPLSGSSTSPFRTEHDPVIDFSVAPLPPVGARLRQPFHSPTPPPFPPTDQRPFQHPVPLSSSSAPQTFVREPGQLLEIAEVTHQPISTTNNGSSAAPTILQGSSNLKGTQPSSGSDLIPFVDAPSSITEGASRLLNRTDTATNEIFDAHHVAALGEQVKLNETGSGADSSTHHSGGTNRSSGSGRSTQRVSFIDIGIGGHAAAHPNKSFVNNSKPNN